MKKNSTRNALSAVAKSPGPKPPCHAATTTERVKSRNWAMSPRAGSSINLAVNTTAVAAIATKYRNDLESSVTIFSPFLILYPREAGGYLSERFGTKAGTLPYAILMQLTDIFDLSLKGRASAEAL